MEIDNLAGVFRPKNVREQLEPKIEALEARARSGKLKSWRWGNYINDKDLISFFLQKEGRVIYPAFIDELSYMSQREKEETIVGLIREMSEDQTLIIPWDANIIPAPLDRKLRKKENLLHVRFSGKPIVKELKDKLKKVDISDTLVGWDFRGTHSSDQRYRVVNLYDMLRAQVLAEKIDNKEIFTQIEVIPYCDTKSTMIKGGEVVVKNMPSFREADKVYGDFRISGLVLYNDDAEQLANPKLTFYLISDHSCPDGTYQQIKYGRKFQIFGDIESQSGRYGSEFNMCHHIILGLKLAKKEIQKQYKKEVVDPFIEGDKETMDFFKKLHNNVLMEYSYWEPNPKTKKLKRITRRKPLNTAEMEIVLSKHVGYRNEMKK